MRGFARARATRDIVPSRLELERIERLKLESRRERRARMRKAVSANTRALRSERRGRRRLSRAMKRTYVVMCLGLGLVFADQNLLAPNLTAIAEDLNLSEAERDYKLGGQIAFAFFLLGAPAAVLIGSLADYYPRTKLFAVGALVGIVSERPRVVSGVTTFGQLYLLRALTGIAVGGAAPLTYSLSSDLFPPAADEDSSGGGTVDDIRSRERTSHRWVRGGALRLEITVRRRGDSRNLCRDVVDVLRGGTGSRRHGGDFG